MYTEDLRLSAEEYGFEIDWIDTVLSNFGPEILALVIEAARNGLSVKMIVEIIDKLTPAVLDLIVDFLNRKNMYAFALENGQQELLEGKFIDLIIEKYLPQIINKYLPLIIEKHGEQLVQLFIDWLLKSLQK